MLALYCDVEHVVRPGDRTSVHVSTTASTFRLQLYSLGGSEPVWSGPTLTGKLVPAGDPTRDWQWPDHPIDIPADLPGGVYLVVGLELDGSTGYEPSLVGYDATALLAITPERPASTALYKLPMRTYLAYNPAGGASLYVNRQWRDGARVAGVRRPGAGIGGPTAEPVDIYAPATRARPSGTGTNPSCPGPPSGDTPSMSSSTRHWTTSPNSWTATGRWSRPATASTGRPNAGSERRSS